MMVVVPDGKAAWKEGELEKGIDEHVAKGPCLHIRREDADYHMDRVQTLDPETVDLLKIVFPMADIKGKMSGADSVREHNAGIRHICGLIDLTLKLNVTHPGITVNWQYPEQLLHPAATLNITDCVMKMIGVMMPDALLHLEAGSDPNVFESLDEFMQHHRPDLTEVARAAMVALIPEFLRDELRKAQAKGRCYPV